MCTNPSLRRYVLWTLKLMKDVPAIFNGKIVFIDLTKQKDQLLSKLQAKELSSADIVIADMTLAVDLSLLRTDVVLAVLNSKT